MQIVIDIPEETYHQIQIYGLWLCPRDKQALKAALKTGVVLPEKHGRLIDADVLRRKWVFDRADKEEIDEAPTILRATESEVEQ